MSTALFKVLAARRVRWNSRVISTGSPVSLGVFFVWSAAGLLSGVSRLNTWSAVSRSRICARELVGVGSLSGLGIGSLLNHWRPTGILHRREGAHHLYPRPR